VRAAVTTTGGIESSERAGIESVQATAQAMPVPGRITPEKKLKIMKKISETIPPASPQARPKRSANR
jgi:hypothetical protein